MTSLTVRTPSAARARTSAAVVLASVALLASCESSGPRTGKLSLTVGGLPTGTPAQVTLKGPTNYSRVVRQLRSWRTSSPVTTG